MAISAGKVGMISTKSEVGPLDGTPDKRMFWSIISDYDLKTGICELIDNAIDLWRIGKERRSLKIEIDLDPDRQLVSVTDDAGGVKEEELRLLLAPGGSRNDPNAKLIGVFGVGGKRAGIAIGEQIRIRTRYNKLDSFEIDIGKEWLESPDWSLPYYRVPDVAPRSTQVDISYLRKKLLPEHIDNLRRHISETYSEFLKRGVEIWVNKDPVLPTSFETWAFPPKFEPRITLLTVNLGVQGTILAEITAGLIRDRDPEADNYGAYFYCNDRLIAKELKSREVGYYVTSEAGVPHPDASLCRVIVRLEGAAILMPWNSSKSGINFDHSVFEFVRPTLIQLITHFSQLSRRLKDDWEGKVFQYETGNIETVDPIDLAKRNPLILPPLPKVRKRQVEKYKTQNKTIISDQPWTLGLVEAMGAVEIIERQRLETKNRIALILLDSNFEIALKEFIVHRTDLFPQKDYPDSKIQHIFSKRHLVVNEIVAKVKIPDTILKKVNHYYLLRNKLIHERATVDILDRDVANYRGTIEKVLAILFDLKF